MSRRASVHVEIQFEIMTIKRFTRRLVIETSSIVHRQHHKIMSVFGVALFIERYMEVVCAIVAFDLDEVLRSVMTTYVSVLVQCHLVLFF